VHFLRIPCWGRSSAGRSLHPLYRDDSLDTTRWTRHARWTRCGKSNGLIDRDHRCELGLARAVSDYSSTLRCALPAAGKHSAVPSVGTSRLFTTMEASISVQAATRNPAGVTTASIIAFSENSIVSNLANRSAHWSAISDTNWVTITGSGSLSDHIYPSTERCLEMSGVQTTLTRNRTTTTRGHRGTGKARTLANTQVCIRGRILPRRSTRIST